MMNNRDEAINKMFSESNKNNSYKDYSNTRVLNMVRESGLNLMELDELIEMKKERKNLTSQNEKKLFQENQRKWLKNKDKEQFIDFNDEYRRKMKNYFNSLDTDGGGSIGVEELEEPLITQGIATDRDGVKALMDTIDKDKSRQIEFAEFLMILKGKNNIFGKSEQVTADNSKIVEFFKDMLDGKVDVASEHLPFQLVLSSIRRRKFLDSFMAKDPGAKEEGQKIMKAYTKYYNQVKGMMGNN